MGTFFSGGKNGFTVVEVSVIIVVSVILLGISGLAFADFQLKARDSERRADILTITQAIEQSYRTQSVVMAISYPTNNVSVADLTNLVANPDATRAPGSTTSSIVITKSAAAQTPAINQYIYQALNLNGTACGIEPCVRYKMYFRLEETNEIIVKDSMRQQ